MAGVERIGEVPIDGAKPIRVDFSGGERLLSVLLSWPTDCTEAEMVRRAQKVISLNSETAGWESEVKWETADGLHTGTVEEYAEVGEPRLGEGYVVRFNSGPDWESAGISLTIGRVDGRTSIEGGGFKLEHGNLANALIEATIVETGRGRSEDIARLALQYS